MSNQPTHHDLSSSDSDSESYGTFSVHGKEPAGGEPYRRKGILAKSSTSSRKSWHKKQKGRFKKHFDYN